MILPACDGIALVAASDAFAGRQQRDGVSPLHTTMAF